MASSNTAPSPPADPLTSPTLSAPSYDLIPNRSRSASVVFQPLRLNDDDSDDEIVWSVSELTSSSFSTNSEDNDGVASDDDYVVLRRPRSPAHLTSATSTPDEGEDGIEAHTPVTATAPLEAQMNALRLETKAARKAAKRKAKKVNKAENALTSRPPAVKKQKKKKKKKQTQKQKGAAANAASFSKSLPFLVQPKSISVARQVAHDTSVVRDAGLGARPIVDDFSDKQSVISYDNESVGSPTIYEEASIFISSFLSNPHAKNDSVCRLTLLQSMIIELGLATPSLPDSLSAAKAFLKSRAFLNIREYIAVREEGPEAVQRAMYPSRSALIKDIKKKRNHTSLKWVKQHGLQVLLVGAMQQR